MATYTQFEQLPIWQEARELYKEIIAITKRPELNKEFRFCSQIKSAAGSVMDNIAEGFERDSNLEFINHLSYAKGSAGEVRSQLYRAFDEAFVSNEEQETLNNRYLSLAANISSLIRYLNQCELRGLKFAGRSDKSAKQQVRAQAESREEQESEIRNPKSEISINEQERR